MAVFVPTQTARCVWRRAVTVRRSLLTCSLMTPALGISESLSSESLSFSKLAYYPCQELDVLPKLENDQLKPSNPKQSLLTHEVSHRFSVMDGLSPSVHLRTRSYGEVTTGRLRLKEARQ